MAGGKGLLPIHSASFCFQNSPAYIALLGAQFQKHGTGEFTAAFANPSHPVMAGLQPFQIWDETYVHTKHNPDRTVLMERAERAGREPWTWVRTHGKGRVFYTAYGHDERIWDNPSFHALMKNAIAWASGPDVAAQLGALAIAAAALHRRRRPGPELRAPQSRAEAAGAALDRGSREAHQVPPGFELQLFASEPLIAASRRRWRGTSAAGSGSPRRGTIPNELQPAGQGNDGIKILEDTDGDGRADKATVFADKLSIASSLVFANGGVIVAQAGRAVPEGHQRRRQGRRARDADRRAGARATPTRSRRTCSTASTTGSRARSATPASTGTVGGKTLNFNQALFRFSPDGKRMEHMANFTNNTWGLAFSETVDVFGSTANGEHSVYVAIPRPYYERRHRACSGDGKKKIDGHYAMQPNTQKIRQVDLQGGFTAAAGHNFYTARAFPEEYWNRIAFVNEPTGHVVHRAIIERQGSGFAAKDGWNLVASDDEWFAPVHAEVGPDGAVWVLDWYNFIIQHNPTPVGPIAQGYRIRTAAATRTRRRCANTSAAASTASPGKGAKPYIAAVAEPGAGRSSSCRRSATTTCSGAPRRSACSSSAARPTSLPQLVAIVNDRAVDRDRAQLAAPSTRCGRCTASACSTAATRRRSTRRRARSTHPAAGVRKAAQSVLPQDGAVDRGDPRRRRADRP